MDVIHYIYFMPKYLSNLMENTIEYFSYYVKKFNMIFFVLLLLLQMH